MLTLGEAQDIFIDTMPGLDDILVSRTPATDAEPTYIEYWQCSGTTVIWYDGPGYPVSVEIETGEDLPRLLQRDIVAPEDIKSVIAWLTQS